MAIFLTQTGSYIIHAAVFPRFIRTLLTLNREKSLVDSFGGNFNVDQWNSFVDETLIALSSVSPQSIIFEEVSESLALNVNVSLHLKKFYLYFTSNNNSI